MGHSTTAISDSKKWIIIEVDYLLKIFSKNELVGRLSSKKYLRVLPMKIYLIFYEINQNNIEIVSFWDNKAGQQKANKHLKLNPDVGSLS